MLANDFGKVLGRHAPRFRMRRNEISRPFSARPPALVKSRASGQSTTPSDGKQNLDILILPSNFSSERSFSHQINCTMRKLIVPSLLTFALLASGCFQTRITTEKTPSSQVIERGWVTGFINGLVMTGGATVDGAQQCSNGVAVVETVHTFPNMLATGITFGIYSPMKVSVTCASGSMSGLMNAPKDLSLPGPATDMDDAQNTLSAAARQSAETGQPVRVRILD